jgi:hypothetical protein
MIQNNLRRCLIESRTAKGEPVVRLSQSIRTASKADPALVVRTGEDQSWRPVQSRRELQEILTQFGPTERSENLGLWKDRATWLLGKPDGWAQDREVTPMGQFWKAACKGMYAQVQADKVHMANLRTSIGPITLLIAPTQ